MALLLVLTVLAPASVAEARPAGEVTLHVHNGSRVPAELFRDHGRRMERLANIAPGSSFSVDAYRGHRFVVFFACSRRAWRYAVRSDIKAEWNLPRKPCG